MNAGGGQMIEGKQDHIMRQQQALLKALKIFAVGFEVAGAVRRKARGEGGTGENKDSEEESEEESDESSDAASSQGEENSQKSRGRRNGREADSNAGL
jgi:hypothetical protein